MFFKTKMTYNLCKAYFVVADESSLDLKYLIGRFFKYSEFKATRYALNYGAERDIATLLQLMGELAVGELESLDVYDAENRLFLSVSQLFAYLGLSFSVYEFTTITNFDEKLNSEVKLFNDLCDVESLIYGYSRFIREDYSIVGEQKITKGLFGGLSISVVPEDTLWMVHPKDIDNGAIKGFYPLNYLTSKAFAVMQQNTNNLFTEQHRDGDILMIDKKSQKEILANSELKKYAYFTST